MNRSDRDIEHQGANLKEQLHAIVEQEMGAFTTADQISEVDELREQVALFMANLQQGFDHYIDAVIQENRAAVENSESEATVASAPDHEQFELDAGDVMNLEKEFGTYGIRQANGIVETKRSTRDTVLHSFIGTAIAASMMWFFWPASEYVEAEVGMEQERVAAAETGNSETPQPQAASNSSVNSPETRAELASGKPAVSSDIESISASVTAEVVTTAKTEPEAAQPEVSTAAVVAGQQSDQLMPEKTEPSMIDSVMKKVEPLLHGEKIRVTAHYGNVRSAPDNSGKVVSRLKRGEVVYKLDEQNGWYQVRLENENTAWVHSSLFAPRLQVGVDVANIRSKPSAKGAVITRLKKGDYVTKTGEQKGWYQVKLDSGKTAWAHRSIF